MKWDEANDRPISAEEMDLDALLEDDLDWVVNLDATDILFKAVEITLERPSLLHRVSNNPLNGDVDSVKSSFHKVTDLPDQEEGETSNHRDAEMGDNTTAGDSEGSLANAV